MAIVNNGGFFTRLSKALTPTGFTPPASVRTISPEYCRTETIVVPKASVQNAVKLTTFQNLINDAVVGVDKQILDIITADYIATNNVEYDYDVCQVSTNQLPSTSSEFYTDSAVNYLVKVEINIKTE